MEEEVTDRVKLAVLKKDELMRNLDSLRAQSSSLLEVSVRWKDIESYFDSTFKLIETKTQEGVDAIRVREEEGKVVAEKRAEEMRVREERAGVLRSAIFGNIYEERKRLVEMEREIEERGKRVELAEKKAEMLKKGVEEGAIRLEDERKRLEKEIVDMRNVVEWRGKRLDQRKKEIDATLKEVEGRESEIEVEKKMAESRSAELDMKEKKLCDIERAVDDISAELKVKRNENIGLQQEVLLLTQKLDVRKTNSSNFTGKSRGGEREEQLSSILKLHHDSQLHESVGITAAYCSSTLNDFDRNQLVYGTASDADQLNAAEFPSTNNAARLSVIEYQSASIAAGSSCVDTALDGRTLQMYFNDLSSNVESWQDEILPVLLKLSDPAKVVLDAMVGFYPPHQIIDGKEFEASVVRRTCLCLLRNLSNLSAGVNATVRDEALRLAFEWKEKMRITDQLEVAGFMDLVLTYRLAKEFSGLELLNLSKIVSAGPPPLKLLRDLGCAGSISSSDIAPNKTNSEVTNRKTSGIDFSNHIGGRREFYCYPDEGYGV
uniref:FRIGIDA-like protein n=1 Tax=Kalanchoe fedtschenkoi TaxID=63787 RepID=A0A7N0TG56_KALFE